MQHSIAWKSEIIVIPHLDRCSVCVCVGGGRGGGEGQIIELTMQQAGETEKTEWNTNP